MFGQGLLQGQDQVFELGQGGFPGRSCRAVELPHKIFCHALQVDGYTRDGWTTLSLVGHPEPLSQVALFLGFGFPVPSIPTPPYRRKPGRAPEKIERGELGLTILPLLALMTGGGTPEFIERWKRAVEREPDEARRRLYRDSVQVLAELTAWQVNWLQGTRDWMMRESQLINSWIREGKDLGRLESARAFLLSVVRRLEDPVPESIRLAVEGTTDLDKLEHWHNAALDARTIADLRQQMQLES